MDAKEFAEKYADKMVSAPFAGPGRSWRGRVVGWIESDCLMTAGSGYEPDTDLVVVETVRGAANVALSNVHFTVDLWDAQKGHFMAEPLGLYPEIYQTLTTIANNAGDDVDLDTKVDEASEAVKIGRNARVSIGRVSIGRVPIGTFKSVSYSSDGWDTAYELPAKEPCPRHYTGDRELSCTCDDEMKIKPMCRNVIIDNLD